MKRALVLLVAAVLALAATGEARDLDTGLTWKKSHRLGSRVNVLDLDPVTGPLLQEALSNGRVRGREPLGAIARRTHAVAAVNGGFFAYAGYSNGEPVGALVAQGRLISETVDGRPDLIVYRDRTRRAKILRLGFKGRVTAGGKGRGLDGVDRPAGFIPGCGGRGGDRPTERPNSVIMCTDPSELVLMNRDFGRRTPPRNGAVEVVVEDGKVTSVRRNGLTPLRRGAQVLTGTGSAARFLRRQAKVGAPVEVEANLTSKGKPLDLGRIQTVVSGDPLLLRRGKLQRIEASPRTALTLVGIKANGHLLLVTIDHRRGSAGATFRQAARLLKSLGARDALSLDSGGSTTMTIGNRTVNRPSDGSPRGISDGLVLTP